MTLLAHLLRNVAPLYVIGAVLVICQVRGAPYWVGAAGSVWMGWVISIAWEAGSVWLWWRADRAKWLRLTKWVCSLALVSGMVAESAGPRLSAALEAGAAAWAAVVSGGFVADGNWMHPKALAAVLSRFVEQAPELLEAGSAVSLAVLMPAFYAVGLTALTVVAREWRGAANGVADAATSPQTPVNRAVAVIRAKAKELLESGATQADVAERYKVNRGTLSTACNHLQLSQQGKRVLSDAQLLELAAKMQV